MVPKSNTHRETERKGEEEKKRENKIWSHKRFESNVPHFLYFARQSQFCWWKDHISKKMPLKTTRMPLSTRNCNSLSSILLWKTAPNIQILWRFYVNRIKSGDKIFFRRILFIPDKKRSFSFYVPFNGMHNKILCFWIAEGHSQLKLNLRLILAP